MADTTFLPALATVGALGHRHGPIAGGDIARVEAALDDASAVVRDAAGRTWIDPETGMVADVPAAVVAVVLAVAGRLLADLGEVEAETAGNYTYRRRRGPAGIELSRAERRAISTAVNTWGVATISYERGA